MGPAVHKMHAHAHTHTRTHTHTYTHTHTLSLRRGSQRTISQHSHTFSFLSSVGLGGGVCVCGFRGGGGRQCDTMCHNLSLARMLKVSVCLGKKNAASVHTRCEFLQQPNQI